ncbi:protein ALP1-like isoform X2 [Solanum dulcamara]|uniref:protein ALP1-like isoform X2 n=1 Tax=Solanum dulcamara TaxID=45834 RepID=UPI0024860E39|nr:protein ALP1-like isoform X2 [Solanum dulcamara]
MATAGRKRGRKKKKKTMMTNKITKLTKKFKATLQLRHQHCTKLIPHLISAISSAHSFLLRHDLHLLPHQSLSLESLISSTSSSISNIVSLLSLPPPPPRAVPPPRAALTSPTDDDPLPSCWFQRFLIADSDTLWAETFNLTKPSFTLLLRLLTPSLSSLSVPPNYALALTLYRLAHCASFSAVSRRFGIDSPTACRVFYTVCKAINENLGHLFELKNDINRVIVGFGWISLPNCCGVLGIEKFELNGDFIGENGFLIVQALVDSEGRFLDVSAGWPCTMRPETVLRKSKLYLGVEESKEYLNGSSFELNDGNSIPQYILGDSYFPLLPWLLTPYSGSNEEDGAEMAFNSVHRKGMQLIGTAFGRVREKWKLLAKKWNEQCIQAFPFVIVTCCLLHNFLIKCSEAVTDETEEYPRCEEFPVFDGEVDESGKNIRDALASHLFRWVVIPGAEFESCLSGGGIRVRLRQLRY